MSLFKILRGDSSRISTDITPFHDGYAYFTPDDGSFYIDINTGTKDAPNNQRIKLNAKDAETLLGASLSSILNESEFEIPTSNAVLRSLAVKQDAIVGSIGDFVIIGADGNVTTKTIAIAEEATY